MHNSQRDDLYPLLKVEHSTMDEVIGQLMQDRHSKIMQDIESGEILVFSRSNLKQQLKQLRHKRQILIKQLNSFPIVSNPQLQQKAIHRLNLIKQTQAYLQKQWQQIMLKQGKQRVKQWSQQQNNIKQHQHQQLSQYQLQQIIKTENIIRSAQEQQQTKRAERKYYAQIKIKQIQQHRRHREELLRMSQLEHSQLRPKFKDMEAKVKLIEKIEKDSKEKQQKDRTRKVIDHRAIRAHSMQCITKAELRLQALPPPPHKRFDPQQHKFTEFLNKDPELVQQQRMKRQRRFKYETQLKSQQKLRNSKGKDSHTSLPKLQTKQVKAIPENLKQ